MKSKNALSLSEYVRRRNGLPLGASGSLRNMLERSFGADSFHGFWQYWNPIWGFYLGRNIFRPLNGILPSALAVVLTFTLSGALHDLAVSLIKWKSLFFFTPWFTLMGLVVVLSKFSGLSLRGCSWWLRALLNVTIIVLCFMATQALVTVLE